MKYYILLFLLIGFTLTMKAQSNIIQRYNYKQKRFLDSLRNAHKLSTVLIQPRSLLVYNMPEVPISNEGEIVGISGQDTIYKMKRDNMRLLKPNVNAVRIPNAADGKIFEVSPAIKDKP